jgi:hypothetical protein
VGGVRRRAGIVALGAALALPFEAEAAQCRGYPESVRSAIKNGIESLRMIEREAADRLVGLDTRTYTFLAGEARKLTGTIANSKALKDEDELKRCRIAVPPVRRLCRSAAEGLATLLDAQEAGTGSNELKTTYAGPMGQCEGFMGLQPLKTTIRTTD